MIYDFATMALVHRLVLLCIAFGVFGLLLLSW
jgi:hypothetical protein